MSQQRPKAGRKGAPSGEGQVGLAQGNIGHGHTPAPDRGSLLMRDTHETPLAEDSRRRQMRESAVHSILNPSATAHGDSTYSLGPPPTQGSIGPTGNLESLYATPSLARENFNRQAHHHGQAVMTESYTDRPNIPEPSYRHSEFPPLPPSASYSDRHMRPLNHTNTLSRLNPDPQLFYERTTLLHRGEARIPDTQIYASLPERPLPASEYAYGEAVYPAQVTTPSPRSSIIQPPRPSGTSASSLATGIGQLNIGRSHDTTGPTTRRGGYRYHTMNTEQGPVSFPLEVQTASRVADEKRRRNAGASARFRARRKEKEHASSREIDGLRQQIQDLEEDVNFYRGERDYLAAELYTSSGNSRHFPRPVSPRRERPLRPRRLTETMSAGSSSREDVAPPYQELGGRTAPERYTRRRLSQQPYGEHAGSVVRSEVEHYLPHSLPHQIPYQVHLPHPSERPPFEPPRPQQAYVHRTPSSPPAERSALASRDLPDFGSESGWPQAKRYKPP